jgi:hypothetical protein
VEDVGDIVGDSAVSASVAWADVNNDSCPEPLVSCLKEDGRVELYRNLGGQFARVANAGPLTTDANNWGAVCWADFDLDGWIDLFIPNRWVEPGFDALNGLYFNRRDFTFGRITNSPLVNDFMRVQGATCGDLDGDGDQDVVIAGDAVSTLMYRNDGEWNFVRTTNSVLEQVRNGGITPSIADYDNDGRLDVFVAIYNTTSCLFHNDGDWQFTLTRIGPGSETGMGAWGDYDNDGHLDLFISRGQTTAAANLLYHNNGDGTFTQITTGSLVSDVGRSPTCIWGDYDNNGFLDLYVPRAGGEAKLLYRNNGNGNHWLLVKLVGTRSNRYAIGAKVHARATIFSKSFTQLREINGGNRAQSDVRAHFGLGDATNVTSLTIEWPSGSSETLSNVPPNRILTVVEPSMRPLRLENDTVQVQFFGNVGQSYTLEKSKDLVTWTNLTTLNGTGTNAVEYVDTTPDPSRRFYRMQEPE